MKRLLFVAATVLLTASVVASASAPTTANSATTAKRVPRVVYAVLVQQTDRFTDKPPKLGATKHTEGDFSTSTGPLRNTQFLVGGKRVIITELSGFGAASGDFGANPVVGWGIVRIDWQGRETGLLTVKAKLLEVVRGEVSGTVTATAPITANSVGNLRVTKGTGAYEGAKGKLALSGLPYKVNGKKTMLLAYKLTLPVPAT